MNRVRIRCDEQRGSCNEPEDRRASLRGNGAGEGKSGVDDQEHTCRCWQASREHGERCRSDSYNGQVLREVGRLTDGGKGP